MAITALGYRCFLSLRSQNLVPADASLLDFGVSKWDGDITLTQLRHDIERLTNDPHKRTTLLNELQTAEKANRPLLAYELSQICFRGILGVSHYSSIDPLTPESTYKFDLNEPVPLREQFGICLNAGTAEHIFNVYQFFKTVYELTAPGGLMIHNAPFVGWPDHGFFNFQPTFYFDLAVANGYTLLAMVFGALQPLKFVQIAAREEIDGLIKKKKIPRDAILQVVLRKSADPVDFSAPLQGCHARMVAAEITRQRRKLP